MVLGVPCHFPTLNKIQCSLCLVPYHSSTCEVTAWCAFLQEAAVKEEGPPPAERNPAAVKYTGNLVSGQKLQPFLTADQLLVVHDWWLFATSACQASGRGKEHTTAAVPTLRHFVTQLSFALRTLLSCGPNVDMCVQGQAPGAPKGVRIAKGPDGSKGFAPGRGRPLPPQPAAAPQPAPGSVRPRLITCLGPSSDFNASDVGFRCMSEHCPQQQVLHPVVAAAQSLLWRVVEVNVGSL